jgi:hypothetical protein
LSEYIYTYERVLLPARCGNGRRRRRRKKRKKRESAQRVAPHTRSGKIITAGVVALYMSTATETQKIL